MAKNPNQAREEREMEQTVEAAKNTREKPGPALEKDESNADQKSSKRSSREGETAPVGITAAECLEQLKTGDTSGLANCPPDELSNVRVPFKEWANAEEARISATYQLTYNAITAEMARKGLAY